MRLRDIMTTAVVTVAASDSAAVAWETMRRRRTRHVVVRSADGGVVGVLSAGDLGGRFGELLRNGRTAGDLMTEKIVHATPDTTVREAANLMRGHVVNCLPVFEDDKLVGIVTTIDLLELLGRGVERPIALVERRIMKNRGVRPQAPVTKTSRRAARR
jgi:acetoin utilization protein AcuB